MDQGALSRLTSDAVRQMLPAVAAEAESRTRGLFCPTHDTAPTLRPVGTAGGNAKWEIEACCEDLLARTQRALIGAS
jgi:hypothetical protein